MESEFWRAKWQNNEIGFHENEVNPLLTAHFDQLGLSEGSCVLVPLCGKTLDIAWLLSKGYRVAGVELVETAVEQLFDELGLEPTVLTIGQVKRYSARHIDVFVGDVFDVSRGMLSSVDAVYDRAALVALPEDVRQRYTAHLRAITDNAPQLLLSFEYDQALRAGPPFSITAQEVEQHYGGSYGITLLASDAVADHSLGGLSIQEQVWLLQRSE